MHTFVIQLNQLLASANKDSWLTGLCELLRVHLSAWVRLTGHNGKTVTEALPSCGGSPPYVLYTYDRPISTEGAEIGRICLSRDYAGFTDEELQMLDIAICIFTVLLHQRDMLEGFQHKQRVDVVREAVNALSFSELEVAIHILQALSGSEGRIVTGNIADKQGITRSIAVTALKKLEVAGMITTRSLGAKGTHIRVKELLLLDELNKFGTKRPT